MKIIDVCHNKNFDEEYANEFIQNKGMIDYFRYEKE